MWVGSNIRVHLFTLQPRSISCQDELFALPDFFYEIIMRFIIFCLPNWFSDYVWIQFDVLFVCYPANYCSLIRSTSNCALLYIFNWLCLQPVSLVLRVRTSRYKCASPTRFSRQRSRKCYQVELIGAASTSVVSNATPSRINRWARVLRSRRHAVAR